MRLVALVLSFTLSGCAGLTGFTNSYFDSNEYGRYIDISTGTRLGVKNCDDKIRAAAYVETLSTETEFAVRYSASKIRNQRITAAGKELQALVTELGDRYSKQAPSVGYCQLKLVQISVAAETIATSIGKKED
jgi:hypothetical protein